MPIVATFATRSEAEMAGQMLTAHGLDVALNAEDAAGVLPHLGFSTGGYTLIVAEGQEEAAQRLLTPDENDSA